MIVIVFIRLVEGVKGGGEGREGWQGEGGGGRIERKEKGGMEVEKLGIQGVLRKGVIINIVNTHYLRMYICIYILVSLYE